tara:strand:+ start:434 stop:655 length:222 start_codon:yes stop_codon:yes gene_type:complete
MIKITNNKNEKSICLLNILLIGIGINKGVLVDTVSLNIKFYKFEIAIFLGKESKDGKKNRQKIKESKNTYASA